jgi:hypothetical protein
MAAAQVEETEVLRGSETPTPSTSVRTPLPSVFQAAERAAEFFDHLRSHYRETRRNKVEIEAEIRLLMDDGSLFDQGSAKVCDISPSGALLGDIHLPKDSFPASPFRIEIVLRSGDYEGIGIHAKPVRFVQEQRGMGVKFEEIFVAA